MSERWVMVPYRDQGSSAATSGAVVQTPRWWGEADAARRRAWLTEASVALSRLVADGEVLGVDAPLVGPPIVTGRVR